MERLPLMDDFRIILSSILLASAILSGFASIHLFRKHDRIARYFSMLTLCIGIYSLGYAMEIFSNTLSSMTFWNTIQYIGIPFLPSIWLLFAFEYNGKPLPLKMKISILLLSVLIMIFRYTSDENHLYYLSLSVLTNGYFPILFIQKGPMYWVQTLFLSCSVIIANYLFYTSYRKSTGFIRRQSQLMLVASFFPWISSLLDLLNIAPLHLDYTPLGLTVSMIIFLIAYYHYHFLNIKPLARDYFFQSTQDGIIVMDKNYTIIDFNPSAVSIITVLDQHAIGKNVQLLDKYEGLVNLIHHGEEAQYDIVESNGSYKVTTVKLFEKNQHVVGYMTTLVDITKYVDMMNELHYLASRDGLTGVYNRRHFVSIGSAILEESRHQRFPLSIMIFDLDHFKQINDQYGHKAGDEVLKMVARVCQHALRPEDILGRYGGEEFVILLPKTALEEAQVIAQQLLTNIGLAEMVEEGKKITVTASLGIMGVDTVTEETLDDFLIYADRALYQAKSEGRNCIRSMK